MPVAEVQRLDGVDAVVLGSAVYFGAWTKEAKAFVEAHRRELSALPTWLFSSGPIDPEGKHGVADDQLEDLARAVAPREHAVFFGRVAWNELGFVERGIVKALRAPVGDFRDWEKIGAFVARIAAGLERAAASAD
jgi:menaquinone-dependent protoporphyrinogen oxidase